MSGGPEAVLDASALLVFLQSEPGAARVEVVLDRTAISAVNWAEVAQKCVVQGIRVSELRQDLQTLGVAILPFTVEDAEISTQMWPVTHSKGLSLADRAALALATRLAIPVLTADRAWRDLELSVEVDVIR